MLPIYLKFKNFMNDKEGQTVVEYCIMVGVVGLAIIAMSPSITDAVAAFFTRVATALSTVGSGS